MSRPRIAITIFLTLAVVALMAWQVLLERRVAQCVASGQVWNGPMSRCEAPRGPILERDGLKRS